eukprot:GDKJ01064322.1.p1 GENE.GDKJ01064322.1~~GDKJ01064322.1.p1  ORF type:complete len:372 (-),score=67.72 GDKJ01064322.1:225-1340(-)
MSRKLVVDTDCGLDDAHALLLALNYNKYLKNHFGGDSVEIVGITCVTGNTNLENVILNVKRVLYVTGNSHIPVARGASRPLGGINATLHAEYYHGLDGFGDNPQCKAIEVDTYCSELPAAMFLTHMANLYQGELEIVALGPLTNLATAYNLDATFSTKLKTVHIMGGNHTGRGNVTHAAEFNFMADPEAAQVVLSDFDCEVEVTTWETTLAHVTTERALYEMCVADTDESRLFRCMNDACLSRPTTDTRVNYESVVKMPSTIMNGQRILYPSFDVLGVDGSRKTHFISCDAIAMVAFLLPQHVQTRLKHRLTVETGGKYSRGLMVLGWVHGRHGNPELSIRDRSIVVTIDHFALEQAFVLCVGGDISNLKV